MFLQNNYYHSPHLIDGETEAREVQQLGPGHPVSGRAFIQTQAVSYMPEATTQHSLMYNTMARYTLSPTFCAYPG